MVTSRLRVSLARCAGIDGGADVVLGAVFGFGALGDRLLDRLDDDFLVDRLFAATALAICSSSRRLAEMPVAMSGVLFFGIGDVGCVLVFDVAGASRRAGRRRASSGRR